MSSNYCSISNATHSSTLPLNKYIHDPNPDLSHNSEAFKFSDSFQRPELRSILSLFFLLPRIFRNYYQSSILTHGAKK